MKFMDTELKNLKKHKKSENPDSLKTETITEAAREKFDQAKSLFTFVVNSDTYSKLKKKASKKLTELEEIEVFK